MCIIYLISYKYLYNIYMASLPEKKKKHAFVATDESDRH